MCFHILFTDEDSNGTIDRDELRHCLEKLHVKLNEEEMEELFHSCDIDGSEGIQFNEFIVLLCLIYILKIPSSSSSSEPSSVSSVSLFPSINILCD